jgi:hypothetical protein
MQNNRMPFAATYRLLMVADPNGNRPGSSGTKRQQQRQRCTQRALGSDRGGTPKLTVDVNIVFDIAKMIPPERSRSAGDAGRSGR